MKKDEKKRKQLEEHLRHISIVQTWCEFFLQRGEKLNFEQMDSGSRWLLNAYKFIKEEYLGNGEGGGNTGGV